MCKILNGSQPEVSDSVIFFVSKGGISQNELCSQGSLIIQITNLHGSINSDIINIENIASLRDDVEIEHLEGTSMFTKIQY